MSTVQGVDQLRAALRASPAAALKAIGAALYREANAIITESKKEVPVDTGVLRASGVVFMPSFSDTGVVVELGYGGAAKAYALVQHERTDYNHRVGKAHYLSDPMARHAQGFEARIAADVSATNIFPGL